jgi:CheY-like chemotaxis protein
MKEMLFLHSDFGLVKSVLINLVSNAIKFTQQGSVMVSVRRRGTDALFQIWDTGIGIPEEALPCIFDEFYQVDNPQRDRNSGLGLGLSIVRRTLELLGSEIKCCSRPGHGTVFEFRLPLHKGAQPPAAEPAPASADDLICVRGKRFMVVEDDLLVSQATRACLEGMGAEVRVFHQAEAALKHALSEAADYYLVDYMLGGEMDGIQFLNQLQEQTFVPVKAVLMTGDTSSLFILHSENFAWQVLYKPLHIPELLASLGLRKGT